MSITNNIKFKTLDQLLVIFNNYGIKCPSTSGTLLKTNSLARNIHSISNCLYYRFNYIPFIKRATIYLGDSFTKRTDYDFSCMKHPGHHNYQTPLLCLPINMVRIFNNDYMHAVLGVTKILLKIYTGKDYIKCCHK